MNQGGEFLKSEYITSVGCAYDPDLRSLAPDYVQHALTEYFDHQDYWAGAVEDAATAEQQYVDLMGVSSRDTINVGSRLFPDVLATGYGKTLAAQKAEAAERELRVAADAVSESALDWSKSDVEYAVWNSLARRGGSFEASPLNLLDYASEAWSLIESARQKASEPLIVVRKRFPQGRSPGAGESESVGFSDVLVADRFKFAMGKAGELDIVLGGVERAKFEEYRNVSYGGRRGLIGSARWEQVWAVPTDRAGGQEIVVEEYNSFVLPDVLGRDFQRRYSILKTLGNLAGSEVVADQLGIKEYVSGGDIVFSGLGDARSSGERQIGFVSGSDDPSIALAEVLTDDEVDNSHANWTSNLQLALEALENHTRTRKRGTLLKSAAAAADQDDFWG
ncbi:hypothetical protein KC973_02040 [Candidatus Saccharibacteria bacterium]|nr:hypothetical protein [Candidatus Saccharibacteria bacterium]